jgi:hypothetical protein
VSGKGETALGLGSFVYCPISIDTAFIVLAVALRPTHSPMAKRTSPSSFTLALRNRSRAQINVLARDSWSSVSRRNV